MKFDRISLLRHCYDGRHCDWCWKRKCLITFWN